MLGCQYLYLTTRGVRYGAIYICRFGRYLTVCDYTETRPGRHEEIQCKQLQQDAQHPAVLEFVVILHPELRELIWCI